jgi:hypothetical protein
MNNTKNVLIRIKTLRLSLVSVNRKQQLAKLYQMGPGIVAQRISRSAPELKVGGSNHHQGIRSYFSYNAAVKDLLPMYALYVM